MAEPARNVRDVLTVAGDADLGPFTIKLGRSGDLIEKSGLPTVKRSHAVPASATAIPVNSHFMSVTAGAAETIATITGGYDGMVLNLLFNDTNVTITDTATEAADTVNLSAALTGADGTMLTLLYDGTSWREIGRSVNG